MEEWISLRGVIWRLNKRGKLHIFQYPKFKIKNSKGSFFYHYMQPRKYVPPAKRNANVSSSKSISDLQQKKNFFFVCCFLCSREKQCNFVCAIDWWQPKKKSGKNFFFFFFFFFFFVVFFFFPFLFCSSQTHMMRVCGVRLVSVFSQLVCGLWSQIEIENSPLTWEGGWMQRIFFFFFFFLFFRFRFSLFQVSFLWSNLMISKLCFCCWFLLIYLYLFIYFNLFCVFS